MQMCPDCHKTYDESVYDHCPHCSGEIAENEAKLNNLKVGDKFYFGVNYGHFGETHRERMQWKVLKTQDDKALVITTDSVCDTTYHDDRGNVTWNDCTLREYLNREFLDWCFTKEERARILSSSLNNDDNPAGILQLIRSSC